MVRRCGEVDGRRIVKFPDTGREAWRCGKVAARFQLTPQWLEATVATLSGGYQTRVKLTAMLLNDVQKQHRQIEDQQAQIETLLARLVAVERRLGTK